MEVLVVALQQELIKVEGMSCNHCKQAVEKAALTLPGVATAEVNLAEKSLRVEYDPGKSTLDDIRAAIDDAGFTAA